MAAPDMDVIREIPGYKVILKAVLKAQIQQLVEQLATHTDEESVILTASVADGTLSHLGSDSGKGFLEDHEDVKSQFLGFCLKRHHKKQQEEEERKRQQQMLESMQQMPVPAQLGYGPAPRRNPRAPFPRQISPRGRGGLGMGIRSPGTRHEPYPQGRHQRNSTGSMPTTPVKLEPSDTSNDGVSESDNVNQSALSRDDEKSNSSSSTIPNEASESNTGSGEANTESGDLDPNVNVKVEAISEADMELEITGVEPGRPMTSQDWDPSVSMGMNFDPNSGATGTSADMQQGYTVHQRQKDPGYRLPCSMCNKDFANKYNLADHMKLHRGEYPYVCRLCNKRFSKRHNLKTHMIVHIGHLDTFN